jgi:hypothetical protein
MKNTISKLFRSGASALGLLLITGWQLCAANPTTDSAAAVTVKDVDGNIYHTVKFGDNHHHQRTGFSIRLIRDDLAK